MRKKDKRWSRKSRRESPRRKRNVIESLNKKELRRRKQIELSRKGWLWKKLSALRKKELCRKRLSACVRRRKKLKSARLRRIVLLKKRQIVWSKRDLNLKRSKQRKRQLASRLSRRLSKLALRKRKLIVLSVRGCSKKKKRQLA